jgi:DeoR/GlpR family transcriptional regulator of sugar metabolism
VLNERQRKAIEYVKKKGSISISEYISLNNVSDKTTRRDLTGLVAKGIFRREGVTTGLKFKLTSVNFG